MFCKDIHIPACQTHLADSDSRSTLQTHLSQVVLPHSQGALILRVRGSGYSRNIRVYDALGVVE